MCCAPPTLRWNLRDLLLLLQAVWQDVKADISRLDRVVSQLCGLSVGMGIVYFAVAPRDEAWVGSRTLDLDIARLGGGLAPGLRDAEALEVAEEALPLSLARRLIRKNSRSAVEEAYTFPCAEPLGEGSFGVVQRAVHNRTGIERAVKRIDKLEVRDRDMWTREVEALRLMDHPHICRIVEYFETSRYLWIVMELCRGTDLCSYLESCGGGVPEPEVAALMAQMLRATSHCHRNAVVHRDLKPDNFVFLYPDAEGRAPGDNPLKLVDFGFALPVGAGGRSGARPRAEGGTLLYTSPETLRGGAAARSDDMWSMGVILYILLTGRFPFSTNSDVRFQQLCDRGQLERDMREHLASLRASPAAVDLVHRLLSVRPDDRPSAEEALGHPFLAGVAPPPSQSSLHETLARFRHSCGLRRVVAAAAAQLVDDASLRAPGGLGDAFVSLGGAAGCYSSFVAASLDGGALAQDERLLRAVFDSLDVDGDGAISAEDLQRRLGVALADAAGALEEALAAAGPRPLEQGPRPSVMEYFDLVRLMRSEGVPPRALAGRGPALAGAAR